MKAYVFPGQASQFKCMGKDLFRDFPQSRDYFDLANQVMGFDLKNIMFEGSDEELKETLVTQPSVFLYSYLSYIVKDDLPKAGCMAGHSLGEITALVASEALSFSDGIRLVKARAEAMQKACELQKGTMAAIVGLDNEVVNEICESINDIVVAANFNCPGQVVISGSDPGINAAIIHLKEAGAKRAIPLAVGGAFHSELMKPAEDELAKVIREINFSSPKCPIYQNVDAKPHNRPEEIQSNLVAQLTSPVLWTQTMNQMMEDGVDEFIECGGKVLSGFVKRVNRRFPTRQI
jgi:[acyl-carrier-protein] S-malonyltransferase